VDRAHKPSPESGIYEQSRRIGSIKLWRIWAKALGEKAAAGSDEAGRIALIRTLIVGVNFITCFFILLNTIHRW
tara:strand:+ start:396 stop:617 length:222 start_codon:yes stop_codon:yes gene_type:complete